MITHMDTSTLKSISEMKEPKFDLDWVLFQAPHGLLDLLGFGFTVQGLGFRA